jgi:hypothetical protein
MACSGTLKFLMAQQQPKLSIGEHLTLKTKFMLFQHSQERLFILA